MHKLSYSIPEAIELLGISRSTIYAEIAANRIRTFNVGTRRLISDEALREWIRAREAETSNAAA